MSGARHDTVIGISSVTNKQASKQGSQQTNQQTNKQTNKQTNFKNMVANSLWHMDIGKNCNIFFLYLLDYQSTAELCNRKELFSYQIIVSRPKYFHSNPPVWLHHRSKLLKVNVPLLRALHYRVSLGIGYHGITSWKIWKEYQIPYKKLQIEAWINQFTLWNIQVIYSLYSALQNWWKFWKAFWAAENKLYIWLKQENFGFQKSLTLDLTS